MMDCSCSEPLVSPVVFHCNPAPGGGTHLQFRHGGLTGFMGLVMKKGMDKGWRTMVRHSIPMVADGIAQGHVPEKAAVKADFKAKHKADVAAAKAR